MTAPLFLRRTATGWEPASISTAADMQRYKIGSEIMVEVKEVRNAAFHRKTMDMIRKGFNYWKNAHPGIEYMGYMATPYFDAYRAQMTIQAGYFHYVINVDGTISPMPVSVSFSKMDQSTFEQYFRSVGNPVLASLDGCFSSIEELMAAEDDIANYF